MSMNYKQFVASRVKWLPGGFPEDLMHACIGLFGEAFELHEATSTANELEELGDLEFYQEHLTQTFTNNKDFSFVVNTEISKTEAENIRANALGALLHHCADLHDKAKKVWVYKKDANKIDFFNPLIRVRIALHFLTEQHQTTRENLQSLNRAKLELRYPTGYTDAAAQARADKVEPNA